MGLMEYLQKHGKMAALVSGIQRWRKWREGGREEGMERGREDGERASVEEEPNSFPYWW